MARSHIDVNGFKVIEAMPISKVGVFPYLGKQIDYDGEMGLEPNKIYNVFRPPEELFHPDAIASFNGKPFIDNHEMLGKDFTKVDNRPADGTIYNVRPSLDMPEYLIADTNIFTEKMIKKIAGGKRELSLGYRCQYVPKAGVYNGQTYEFVQTNLRGNHLALVEHGRCGSSVCVCDGALITMDSLPREIQDMEKDEKKEAKLGAKLAECLNGADEQCCQDALDFLDLPPDQRKAALAAVKNGEKKDDAKADTPAEDSKAKTKDADDVPTPPPADASEPDKDEKEANAPVGAEATPPGEAPAKTPAAPAPAAEPPAAEEAEEGEPAEDGCKGKGCKKRQTKDEAPKAKEGDDCPAGGKCKDDVGDGKCDACGKPVATDGGEPCCHEGKGGKPCCEDKDACKGDECCDNGCATVTAPSIPVPKSKVTDEGKGECCDCGDKGKTAISKDELDALTAQIRADYSRAQKLAKAIRPMVDTFDSSEMSEVEVARHAVKHIPALAFAADSADDVVLGVVRGYIANRSARETPKTVKVPTADEAIPKHQSNPSAVEHDLQAFYK